MTNSTADFTGPLYEYRVIGTTTVEGFPHLDHVISGDNEEDVIQRTMAYVNNPALQGITKDLSVMNRRVVFPGFANLAKATDWVAAMARAQEREDRPASSDE